MSYTIDALATRDYTHGLHEVADQTWAWLQPDGGWGWSNAGLIVDGDETLLVDTLYDVPLTAAIDIAQRELGTSRFSSWGDAEPVVINVDTLYREFSETDERTNVVDLFTQMAALTR